VKKKLTEMGNIRTNDINKRRRVEASVLIDAGSHLNAGVLGSVF